VTLGSVPSTEKENASIAEEGDKGEKLFNLPKPQFAQLRNGQYLLLRALNIKKKASFMSAI
jgi:hypothetical protein